MTLSTTPVTPASFTTLADLLPVAVYTCDREGVITYCNQRAIELWGRMPTLGVESDERFCGSFRLWNTDGEFLPHEETPMAEALRSGTPAREREVVIERPDGSRTVVAVNIDPLFDDAGEIIGAVNAFQDVTERVRAAGIVAESEQRYRELIEALGVAVYTTDAEGRITLFNEAAVQLWGRRPTPGDEKFCGSLKLFAIDGTPIRHEDCPMGITLREDRIVRDVEAIAERPDGTRVRFLPFPTPFHDASGNLIGGVNVLIDVTERRRAEQAARDGQAHLDAIFRSTITGMVEIEPDGTFVMANDRYCELVGRSRAELLSGMTKLDVTHPDDRQATRRQLQALANGEDFFTLEKRYQHPDGTIVWVHNGVSALRDASGRLTGAIGIVTDITALVHATLELEEANSKKDEFLGLVSHELRTPITTILGNAKILADRGGTLSDEQRKQSLNDVKNEAARLNRIIENLLSIARLERGQFVETEPVMIGRVIKRIVDSHAAVSRRHAYVLESRLEDVVVDVNEVHVEQIMTNLLSNAEKYAPHDTPVRIIGRVDAGEVIVSVEDAGAGVEDDELDAVFDPFFRSAAMAHRAGIGIGLTVCRRLAEAMGGRIWAERGESGGARFSFSLPLVAEPATERS